MIDKKEFDNLRLAKRNDFQIIHKILTTSFQADPHVNWLLESSTHKNKLSILVSYVIEEYFSHGHIYITDDDLGVAIWKTNKKEKFSFGQLKRDVSFLINMGIKCVIRNLKSLRDTNKHFPNDRDYYYLCMIGVHPQAQGNGLASKLMKPVIDMCNKLQTPIFLETGNEKNVEIYKKKGFRLTDIISRGSLNTYYMKS